MKSPPTLAPFPKFLPLDMLKNREVPIEQRADGGKKWWMWPLDIQSLVSPCGVQEAFSILSSVCHLLALSTSRTSTKDILILELKLQNINNWSYSIRYEKLVKSQKLNLAQGQYATIWISILWVWNKSFLAFSSSSWANPLTASNVCA